MVAMPMGQRQRRPPEELQDVVALDREKGEAA